MPSSCAKALLILVSTCYGCVPATSVQVPALSGRVLEPDGKPANEAIIHLVRDRDQAEIDAFSATADGSFKRPEHGKFFFLFPGADAAVTTYSVFATSGAHRSPDTKIKSGVRRFYDASTDRDLGTLQLR
jgi:hypothetical protein